MTEIVNDLLEVSRIEAGAISLSPEIIDVRTLVDDCINRLKIQFEKKNQSPKMKAPKNLPLIEADPNRINQVLINLLSNAHKYSPDGSEITVEIKELDHFIQIAIRDTGIGISKDDQKKLFSKFYRVKNEETIKAGGTGLGLWITKSLVEMHGGTISVRSKLGKGTTFSFTLSK